MKKPFKKLIITEHQANMLRENEEGVGVKVYKDDGGATVRVFPEKSLFDHVYKHFYVDSDRATYDDTVGDWEVFYHNTSDHSYYRQEIVLINKKELTIKSKVLKQEPLFTIRHEDMTEKQEYKMRSVERRHGWTYQGMDELGNVIVQGNTDVMKINREGKIVD